MLRRVKVGLCLGGALSLLGPAPLAAQPAVADEICVSCHAEPSTKFHSQPSHKKLACASCHLGGAAHVADTRARPRLGGGQELCASCHEAKRKHSRPG
ncbi:MAG: hypothetical protein MUF32_04050 [Burkholderiaceae bacterium]|jgi:hypothetical protein|nr:hypothetical protein [Burkholderiaceae bacterium]